MVCVWWNYKLILCYGLISLHLKIKFHISCSYIYIYKLKKLTQIHQNILLIIFYKQRHDLKLQNTKTSRVVDHTKHLHETDWNTLTFLTYSYDIVLLNFFFFTFRSLLNSSMRNQLRMKLLLKVFSIIICLQIC